MNAGNVRKTAGSDAALTGLSASYLHEEIEGRLWDVLWMAFFRGS
jgi:hypothetical protein